MTFGMMCPHTLFKNAPLRTKLTKVSNQRDVLIRIFDQFRDCQCLWKKNHPDYLNVTKINDALDSFIDLFKLMNPEADSPDRETVRNWLKHIRTTYDAEREKVNESLGLYEPSLWWYKRLAFLEGDQIHRKPDQISPRMSREFASSSFASTSSAFETRKLGKDQFEKKISFTSFGDNVVEKLQSLQAPIVPFCQKLINDALYYAEIGELDSTSKIVTTKPKRRRMTDSFVPPINLLDALEDFMRR